MRKIDGIDMQYDRFFFTPAHDAYIIAHRQTNTLESLGRKLGASESGVQNRVRKLMAIAKSEHDIATIEALSAPERDCTAQPLVITDGYDTVPWHMRQSTRFQGLTLDFEP